MKKKKKKRRNVIVERHESRRRLEPAAAGPESVLLNLLGVCFSALHFSCMGEHVKFVRLPLSCAELCVTFNLCRCTAVMKYLLWECDDQMTLSTFARTLSGVDLVRHGDQSGTSQPLSVGLSVCRPRVLIKPILHSAGERTACPLYRGQKSTLSF